MTSKLVLSLTSRRVEWLKKKYPNMEFGHAVTKFAIDVEMPRITVAQWFKTEPDGDDVVPRDSTLRQVLSVHKSFPH